MEKNFKILIEIFCEKRIVSNVILPFLDHLKPETMVADIERHPFSKSLDPLLLILECLLPNLMNYHHQGGVG